MDKKKKKKLYDGPKWQSNLNREPEHTCDEHIFGSSLNLHMAS